MLIWDTAGGERFKSISNLYYRGVHGIFLVFDLNVSNSFNSLEKWINEINSNIQEKEKLPPIILLGNKSDLET